MIVSGAELLLAAAVLLSGAALQSAVGFGMGMASVPLLLWLGVPLPHAVAALNGASIVQAALASHRLRQERQGKLHLVFASGQWLGLPLGLVVMGVLETAGELAVQRAVGVFLLAAIAARVALRPVPRDVGAGWTAAASLSSGALSGTFGMGGPPMVFWTLAHPWSADRVRAFLLTQVVLVSPAMLALLALEYGPGVLASAGAGVALTPVIWLVTVAAQAASAGWDRRRLQSAALIVLTIIGVRSLFG